MILWFYLNYVGCKVISLRNSQRGHSKFYLNYVGCKGSIESEIDWGDGGFTLTMWDVKFKIQGRGIVG